MTKQLEPSGNAFFLPTTLEQRITQCGAKAKAFLYDKIFNTFKKDAECVRGYLEQLNELNIWRKREPVRKLQMCQCLPILDICTVSQPVALQRSWNCSSGALANTSAPSTCQQGVSGSQVRL